LTWHRPAKEHFVRLRNSILLSVLVVLLASAWAQESKSAGVLKPEELKAVAPASFFYRGRSAATQLRNSAGVRTSDGKFVLAGLVDTAGYASNIAEKYQGFLITEVKIKVEGSELAPGEYGFGFVGDKFVVTDVGANEILGVSAKKDDNLKRPTPLKIAQEGSNYRLYAGKKYVTLAVE
jgi:hypothetical protein